MRQLMWRFGYTRRAVGLADNGDRGHLVADWWELVVPRVKCERPVSAPELAPVLVRAH